MPAVRFFPVPVGPRSVPTQRRFVASVAPDVILLGA